MSVFTKVHRYYGQSLHTSNLDYRIAGNLEGSDFRRCGILKFSCYFSRIVAACACILCGRGRLFKIFEVNFFEISP